MKLQRKIINLVASLFVLGTATMPAARAADVALDFSAPEANVAIADRPVESAPGSELSYSIPHPLRGNAAQWVENSDKNSHSKAIASTSAAELFATAKSPGAIAVGAAEGNLTATGETTSRYSGHIDPGNHVTNRGFCSWNKAKNLTVAEADRRCVAALQRQGSATEQKLQELGIDPKTHAEVLVNGTDLSNQSNRAGADFPVRYKQAIEKGLSDRDALLDARVESFRNEAGKLDASGLFGICAREPYYQSKLAGKLPYSESWRWQCIALDQERRVGAVDDALKQNRGDTNATSHKVLEAKKPAVKADRPTSDEPTSEPAVLSFEPGSDRVSEPVTPGNSSVLLPRPPTNEASEDSLKAAIDRSLDFSVPAFPAVGDAVEEQPLEKTIAEPQSKAPQTPVFSGKAISKVGGAIAKCTVTDYRRFRNVHPVLGLSPRMHNGIDVACPRGTHTVYSPASGTLSILQPSDSGGGGLVARIQTDDGWTIQNMHMLEISHKEGAIAAGEKLGIGGAPFGHPNAGTGTGPHSHYERFKVVNGKRQYVDPTDTELKALLGVDS